MTAPVFYVGDAVRVAPAVKRVAGRSGYVVIVDPTAGPLITPVPGHTPLGDRDTLPRHPEYGVILTDRRPTRRRDMPGQLNYDSGAVNWFAPHELEAR